MNRLLSGCMGCVAATLSGLTVLAPNAPAAAGVLPLAAVTLSWTAPASVVAVQWNGWNSSFPRQPWDYAWGAPPYSFPGGRQPHVMYYAAAPYYYPGFQTTLGYNGHFGYPGAVQYADPPPVSRGYYPPRSGSRLEAFD
jgi:hypothetical protein